MIKLMDVSKRIWQKVKTMELFNLDLTAYTNDNVTHIYTSQHELTQHCIYLHIHTKVHVITVYMHI